ncbi:MULTISPECIES: hypothetical protein [Amycolatopsis]|uniref:Uncharacterized protein n=1 Tax=Amycolatopsis dendrobii TaxID=2760662 RepID=A0A7W3VSV9_9PSEU|nr:MULTISPECIES: hypothetical protein [Amycolatopsis]MBB1152515.1 hypothetical protein [Amycolatopsis dendrobii]UKD52290.1 hypothetical protein L3Q65_30825 [Amycolatopsis sp. FU40]
MEIRSFLPPYFTAGQIHKLRPMIGVLVGQQLKVLEPGGNPADLVEAFAGPLPLRTGCVARGIPPEAEADLDEVTAHEPGTHRCLDRPWRAGAVRQLGATARHPRRGDDRGLSSRARRTNVCGLPLRQQHRGPTTTRQSWFACHATETRDTGPGPSRA